MLAHDLACRFGMSINFGAGIERPCGSGPSGINRKLQGIEPAYGDWMFLPYGALEIDDDNGEGRIHSRNLVALAKEDR